MEFSFSDSQRAFRDTARRWIAKNCPGVRPSHGTALSDYDLEWQRRKYEGGFAGLTWPKEYGGQGLTLVEQMIWYEECARAGAPFEGCLSVALNHAGPTIGKLGSEELKATHLPKILRGEVVWCQGFSEPNSGSDLASLRTSAVVEGDRLVINGQKIWTSYAQYASYQELLVRTSTHDSKHNGLTWLVCDMRQPGITVRPIDTMADDKHFCEVFYDNVEVPVSNVVGGIDKGWRTALATLSFERGSLSTARSAELVAVIEKLIELAKHYPSRLGSGRAIDDGEIASELGSLRAEVTSLKSMNYANVSHTLAGNELGTEVVVDFLYFGEILKRARDLSMVILGATGLELEEDSTSWARRFLSDRHYTIAGGTSEVRRNIIAERMLGLPRSY